MEPIKITSVLVNPELLEKNRDKPLLLKLMIGNKYMFWKVLKISTALDLKDQLTREVKVPNTKSVFYKLVNWIRKSKIYELRIEIISGYDDKSQLLINEYNLIKHNRSDKNLLVKESNIDYYPKWIPQDAINIFKKFYTTGKQTGASNKDKNLKRFLNTLDLNKDITDKIYNYLKTRYK